MVDAIPNTANKYTRLAFGFPVIPQSQQQDMQYYILSL